MLEVERRKEAYAIGGVGSKQKRARGGRRIPEDDRILLWSNDECIQDSGFGLGGHIVNVAFCFGRGGAYGRQ